MSDNKMTTIKVSTSVHNKLEKLKRALEFQYKKEFTYGDTVETLIVFAKEFSKVIELSNIISSPFVKKVRK